MQDGFGPVGAQAKSAVTVDLDKAGAILSNLLIAGHEYNWGVLLVTTNPYQRLQYLGGGQRFRFEYSGGGSSSSGGDSGGHGGGGNGGGGNPKPTATPR